MVFYDNDDHYNLYNSLISIGGKGLYILQGHTDSGKNVFLKDMLTRYSHDEGNYESITILSNTAEHTDDFDFLNDIGFPEPKITENLDDIKRIYIKLKIEKTNYVKKNKGDRKTLQKKWIEDHPTLFIFNDFFSLANLSAPNNPVLKIVSDLRHVGGTIILNTQSITGLNPNFYENSRMVISFTCPERNINKLKEKTSLVIDSRMKKIIQSWCSRKYYCTIWVINWFIDKPIPIYPLLVYPVQENKPLKIKKIKFH